MGFLSTTSLDVETLLMHVCSGPQAEAQALQMRRVGVEGGRGGERRRRKCSHGRCWPIYVTPPLYANLLLVTVLLTPSTRVSRTLFKKRWGRERKLLGALSWGPRGGGGRTLWCRSFGVCWCWLCLKIRGGGMLREGPAWFMRLVRLGVDCKDIIGTS